MQTTNLKIVFDRQSYEVFWTSINATHVIARDDDPSHGFGGLAAVERFAASARFLHLGKFHYRFFCDRKGRICNVVATITATPSKRCVIKICAVVNKVHFLEICRGLNL